MKKVLHSQVLVTGFAIFSMFFGAGNVVFPLALGQYAGNHNHFAMMGLLITAVGVPLMGLVGMVLFEGNVEKFYLRIGKVAGIALITLIIAIIGPFGAMPRCVTLAHSAIQLYFPHLSLFVFSLGSGLVIYVLSLFENKIISILGYVLSPLLLLSLGIIIVKGLLITTGQPVNHEHALPLFVHGLYEGYNTMDLLATGFFSYIVIASLQSQYGAETEGDTKKLAIITAKASVVGAVFLALVYTGMSYVASFHTGALVGVPPAELMTKVAYVVLGPTFGFIASVAVSLACLTTAMALAAVSSDYLRYEVLKNKISYTTSLAIVVVLTTIFANLGFAGVMKIIIPMVVICYPALIVLTITNILYKLFDFKPVKTPFFITLAASTGWYIHSIL